MKRQLLYWAALILVLNACNNNNSGLTGEEATPYDGLAPVIKVGNDAFDLRDTMKFTVQQEYVFSFTIEDDQTERILKVNKLQNGLLFFQGKIMNDAETNISGIQSGQITFRALQPGLFNFNVSVEDPQGLSSSIVIELNVLDNMLPVARMQITQTAEVSPYQIAVDAAQSYDQDERWGGQVKAYEFTVDEFYSTETIRPKLEYIFPEVGTYRIVLRVKDNDDEWSEALTRQVSIK